MEERRQSSYAKKKNTKIYEDITPLRRGSIPPPLHTVTSLQRVYYGENERVISQWRNLTNITKVNINNHKLSHIDSMYTWYNMMKITLTSVFFTKTHNPSLIIRKIPNFKKGLFCKRSEPYSSKLSIIKTNESHSQPRGVSGDRTANSQHVIFVVCALTASLQKVREYEK